MQKLAQIVLYNQLRDDYLHPEYTHIVYIHNTGKIKFQWQDLELNIHSKIIDYAWWREYIRSLQEKGKKADFLIESSFFRWIIKHAAKNKIKKYGIVKPVEDYVYKNFLKIKKKLEKVSVELEFLPDTQSFFLSHEDFLKQYKKPPIMEYFYRFMRKREHILMDENNEPQGWKWNYDAENRKFDKKHTRSWSFSLEKNNSVEEAEKYYSPLSNFPPQGALSPAWSGIHLVPEGERASSHYNLPNFIPTNRSEALELLEYFCENHLENFGKLEDAMYKKDNYVHHSLLSTAINFGFLSPREVLERALSEPNIPLSSLEGFVRQILGWREYMYHFFQFYKDTIHTENYFSHTRKLPSYFWSDAELCEMNCLSQTLKQVQSEHYSHHIQRLMVIGNFALLSGLDPHELNRWFFEYYTDAFEWVVTPNVLSMSQFADGGKLATKPYIASANYINSMSDYCKNCHYNPKEKYTENACPFNYLYWNFVADNKTAFEKRQPFIVKNLTKIDLEKVREQKEKFLKTSL